MLKKSLVSALILGSVLITCFLYCKRDNPSNSTNADCPEFKVTDNVVSVSIAAKPDLFNPFLTSSSYARQIMDDIFAAPLHMDPFTFDLIPVVAKSRPNIEEITEGPYAGGLKYEMEFREEAVWGDGTPITGYDYLFTLKAILNPLVGARRFRPYVEFITNVEIDPENDKKVTVYTSEKYILGEEVVGGVPYILPEYHYDPDKIMRNFELEDLRDLEKISAVAEQDDRLQTFADYFQSEPMLRENVVGAGPYDLEEWVPGERIVLKRKENWWGNQLKDQERIFKVGPDKIVYRPITDQAAKVTAVKGQDLDVGLVLDPTEFDNLKASDEYNCLYNFFNPRMARYTFVYMNRQSPKLADKRVRRAMAHLMDVNTIITNLWNGYAQPAVGPVHPDADYYHKDLPLIEFDIERAKALFAEAGWQDSNGDGILDKTVDGELVEMKFELLTSTSSISKGIGVLFADAAKEAGVEITPVSLNFNVQIGRLRNRDYEISTGALEGAPTPWDPKQVFHTESSVGGGSNRVYFGNDESDELIDKIRTTLDKEERRAYCLRLQEIIYEDQPFIFIAAPQERMAVHKRFEPVVTTLRPGVFPRLFAQIE